MAEILAVVGCEERDTISFELIEGVGELGDAPRGVGERWESAEETEAGWVVRAD